MPYRNVHLSSAARSWTCWLLAGRLRLCQLICCQLALGNPAKVSISAPAPSRWSAAWSMPGSARWSTTRRCCAHTDSGSGWAKMVLTIVATMASADRGTLVNRLRRQWVRHRCHDTPGRVAAMASRGPGWSSEVTSCTPDRPRALRLRQNTSQAAPSSPVATSRPNISRCPSLFTPTASSSATFTTRPPSRHLTTVASAHA